MKKVSPAARPRDALLMWKNDVSHGAISADTTPTHAAASEQAHATRRMLRMSSAGARRANDSRTFCGPISARNVTNVSARLRLSMGTIMSRPAAGNAGDTHAARRARRVLSTACHGGIGALRRLRVEPRVAACADHRPEPAEDGHRRPVTNMGVAGSRTHGPGSPGRRNPDVTRQGHPDRPLRAAAVAGRAAGRASAR